MSEKISFIEESLAELNELSHLLEKLENRLQKIGDVDDADQQKLATTVNKLRRNQIDMREELLAIQDADEKEWLSMRDAAEFRMYRLKDFYARAVSLLPPG